MSTAQTIREAIAEVDRLRAESRSVPAIGMAVERLKRLQSRRFAASHADLLASAAFGAATRFFLEELYGARDYSERDGQFARIAGAVEKLFPKDVADTAIALARLHVLTESLDHALARALPVNEEDEIRAYVRAWKSVGRRADRDRQLQAVLDLGGELARLTRLPGLRMMLRVMRKPAAAAGLTALQRFLEQGFDTFAEVSRQPQGAERFLATVAERERQLIQVLSEADAVACETALRTILGQAL
ncbi:hypothetical protein JJB11_08835 [Ramlibacter ginsenosidimutans]|uniref:DUF8198 domain-containing protein n=2 Tax=Ramlibacter ginsenosidimutans TaxID=502333 RepID=A0A934TRF0_9BURK|nr:hypothetical protein [Ramlibacter ginsenosidimutans]MBK6006192.1 hypothetical protein [Ramlibacter ginsenosidimutans]